jgi:hypothetical protein
MRETRSLVILNSKPWMLDFRSSVAYAVPASIGLGMHSMHPLFNKWDGFSSARRWHQNIRYISYDDEERVVAADAAANHEQHLHDVQPPLQIDHYMGGNCFPLPEPSFSLTSVYDVISSLLHVSFRRQDIRRFHEDTVQLKAIPSVGARHGLEVFVRTGSERHYYDCGNHTLYLVDHHTFDNTGAIHLDLYIRPEVYMWRYPVGTCLADIYLELGHGLGNLSLGCLCLGIANPRISEVPDVLHDLLWPALSIDVQCCTRLLGNVLA